ncbi:MAG TPA: Mov34/MPN/PAD-1 family protein [Polyangia bacterium]|nr:Mov34/MPN/PAD-1 family protein [Polyangia bacterium]
MSYKKTTVAAPHPVVTPEAMAELYAHALREYPNESCGFVYGAKDAPTAGRAVACVNTQNELHAIDPKTHERDATIAYNLGASDLFKLQKSLRSAEPVKVIYHSHVDVGAYFSATDQAAAQMDGEPSYPVEYVVVDCQKDGAKRAAQFCWSDAEKKYVEVGTYE